MQYTQAMAPASVTVKTPPRIPPRMMTGVARAASAAQKAAATAEMPPHRANG
jgi:hypothetical protein